MAEKRYHRYLLYQSKNFSIEFHICHQHHTGLGREEWSEEHSIAFVRAGSYVRYDASGKAVADTNQVLFYPKDAPYQISHPIKGGDVCAVFNFDPTSLKAVGLPVDPQNPFPVDHMLVNVGHQMEQFQLIKALQAKGKSEQLEIEERLLTLIGGILQDAAEQIGMPSVVTPSRDDTLRRHRNIVHEARLYILENYQRKLTLEDIAGAVCTSPYHLTRLFKTHTGLPVYRYLRRLRLTVALNQLANPLIPLTELALNTGFSSHSQFTETFRRAFGTIPSRVRSQL